MNIVYIFDNNYAAISGVSLLSLLENNRTIYEIAIYIIDGGISNENKLRLNEIVKKFKRKIYYLKADNPEKVLGMKLNIRTWSYSNFFRLYLDKILPSCVEKALYIDSDTLILNEVGSLYDTDMCDNKIGATYDCAPTPKYDLGLRVLDKYYSDGILLLNIKKMRDENTFEQFRECLQKFNGNVSYLEQGVINYVLKDEILLIPAKYNVMTLSLIFDKIPKIYFLKKEPYYSKKEIMAAIANPTIVHITGHPICTRPWYHDSNHPYCSEWMVYLKKTEWKNDFQYGKISRGSYEKYKIYWYNMMIKYKWFQILYALCSKRMFGLIKYRLKIFIKKK